MIKWKKMIKRILYNLVGRCKPETHRVEWRKELTVYGFRWKRIHYPLQIKGNEI
jgi:hypothetical protein